MNNYEMFQNSVKMALPHMQSSYTTRKNIYEAAMVTRRTRENDFRQQWDKNADYFNRENVTANVKKTWESNTYFKNRYACIL